MFLLKRLLLILLVCGMATPLAAQPISRLFENGQSLDKLPNLEFKGDVDCVPNESRQMTECTFGSDFANSPAASILHFGSGRVITEDERNSIGQIDVNVKRTYPIVIEYIQASDDFVFEKAPFDLTISDIDCIIDPADTGDSAPIEIFECDSTGDNCTTVDAPITCDNDGQSDDGVLTNPTIDEGDWLKIESSACTGTCDFTSITIVYTKD